MEPGSSDVHVGPISMATRGAAGLHRPQAVYRLREATPFKGVTKTSGTNSGVEKYDVQFVFCDGGTKKHPKIYGFSAPHPASRAFDILTCRRAIEKGRMVSEIIEAGQSLGTNHPLTDYNSPAFVQLLTSASRDDIIYGLKQAAKRNYALTLDTLVTDMTNAVAAANRDAEERVRLGEPRQSYEPNATGPTSGERKRKPGGGGGSSRRRRLDLTPLSEGPMSVGGTAALQLGTGDLAGLPMLTGDLQQSMLLAQMLAGGQVLPGLLQIPSSATAEQQRGPGDGTTDVVIEPKPADGLVFVQELCRAAAQSLHQPELACAADLLRIWEVMQYGEDWEKEQYTLPAHLYNPHIAALQEAPDLRAALAVCHDLWQRRILHDVFSLYVSTLTSNQILLPTGLADQAMGGSGGSDNTIGSVSAQAVLQAQALLAAQAMAAGLPQASQDFIAQQRQLHGAPGEDSNANHLSEVQEQQMQLQSIFYTLHNGEAPVTGSTPILALPPPASHGYDAVPGIAVQQAG